MEESTEPPTDVVAKPNDTTTAEPTTEETELEGFPAGWRRVKHQKPGGKARYTFTAPDGTKYKSLKLAKVSVDRVF